MELTSPTCVGCGRRLWVELGRKNRSGHGSREGLLETSGRRLVSSNERGSKLSPSWWRSTLTISNRSKKGSEAKNNRWS
ncbi:hypothetical protein MUK42_16751 [Musa troglodytarum]|uniref:Uncharacterized protein n=1 Tax=Musa troglodytarum TaxID=320322 RepID=A0A9E7HNC9_9LILI|nr:hypothetical protein MUK42_16751 [Musa troglodytarum]